MNGNMSTASGQLAALENDSSMGSENRALTQQMLCTTNIDRQPFCTRRLLADRLRSNDTKLVPILLYWHPDAHRCSLSVHQVPPAARAKKSFLTRAVETVFGEQATVGTERPALIKLLAPKKEALRYIASNVRKKLLQLARNCVAETNENFDSVWHTMKQTVDQNCTDWSADGDDDKSVVVVFHATRSEPIELHDGTRLDWLDKHFQGDDQFLRLFVSFEFRKLHRQALRRHVHSGTQTVTGLGSIHSNSNTRDVGSNNSGVSSNSSGQCSPSIFARASSNVAFVGGRVAHTAASTVGGTVTSVGQVVTSAVSSLTKVGSKSPKTSSDDNGSLHSDDDNYFGD